MELLEKERIDDLQYKGLKIIQKEDEFCFGIDSVLLSDFAKDIKSNSDIIDFKKSKEFLYWAILQIKKINLISHKKKITQYVL